MNLPRLIGPWLSRALKADTQVSVPPGYHRIDQRIHPLSAGGERLVPGYDDMPIGQPWPALPPCSHEDGWCVCGEIPPAEPGKHRLGSSQTRDGVVILATVTDLASKRTAKTYERQS